MDGKPDRRPRDPRRAALIRTLICFGAALALIVALLIDSELNVDDLRLDVAVALWRRLTVLAMLVLTVVAQAFGFVWLDRYMKCRRQDRAEPDAGPSDGEKH